MEGFWDHQELDGRPANLFIWAQPFYLQHSLYIFAAYTGLHQYHVAFEYPNSPHDVTPPPILVWAASPVTAAGTGPGGAFQHPTDTWTNTGPPHIPYDPNPLPSDAETMSDPDD